MYRHCAHYPFGVHNTMVSLCACKQCGFLNFSYNWCAGFFQPNTDVNQGGTNDIISFAGEQVDGKTSLLFRRKVDTGDQYDRVIRDRNQVYNLAKPLRQLSCWWHCVFRNTSGQDI